MIGVTSNSIVNAAIQEIGDNQPAVTGEAPTFDSSPAGVAAQKLYTLCVQTIARRWGYDFARNTLALTLSGNAAPFGWAFEYLYPANGIQIREVLPAALADPNDPLPVNWVVANAVVSAVPVRVIHTDQAGAQAVITNQPPESAWDSDFTEAVVRLLASEFAMALAGRPDTARDQMGAFNAFETDAMGRDN